MKKSIKINALLNMIKQLMQVVFPLITIPYINRVLLPENVGRLDTGNSIISYIALIAGLGITPYAIREGSLIRHNKDELNKFSNQVFSINLVSTLISYLILVLILLFIPHYYDYRKLIVIQSVMVVFTTLGADWINSIEEDYLYITVRYIILHAVSLLLMFIFVKKPQDYYIYATITLITSAGSNLMNIFYIRRYVKLKFVMDFDFSHHIKPIMILFSNTIATTIYVSSDITMIDIIKGPKEVGIYGVSTKIYTIVKQILNAMLIVSVPRMTAYVGTNKKSDFIQLGEKILNVLVTLMCPIVVGIFVFRKEAVLLAGGERFLDGTKSLFVLSIAIAVSLIASFYSACILMPLRKERLLLKGTVISATINILLNLFMIPALGGVGAAITTLVSEMFVAVYFSIIAKNEGYFIFLGRVWIVSIAGGVVVSLICIIIRSLFSNLIIYLPLSFVISAIVYFQIHYWGKNEVVIGAISSLISKLSKSNK